MRQTIPVARRVLGDSNELTIMMRMNYARALYTDDDTTLDDLRESVTMWLDVGRIAWRVLSTSHPLTAEIAVDLRCARAALRARETE